MPMPKFGVQKWEGCGELNRAPHHNPLVPRVHQRIQAVLCLLVFCPEEEPLGAHLLDGGRDVGTYVVDPGVICAVHEDVVLLPARDGSEGAGIGLVGGSQTDRKTMAAVDPELVEPRSDRDAPLPSRQLLGDLAGAVEVAVAGSAHLVGGSLPFRVRPIGFSELGNLPEAEAVSAVSVVHRVVGADLNGTADLEVHIDTVHESLEAVGAILFENHDAFVAVDVDQRSLLQRDLVFEVELHLAAHVRDARVEIARLFRQRHQLQRPNVERQGSELGFTRSCFGEAQPGMKRGQGLPNMQRGVKPAGAAFDRSVTARIFGDCPVDFVGEDQVTLLSFHASRHDRQAVGLRFASDGQCRDTSKEEPAAIGDEVAHRLSP